MKFKFFFTIFFCFFAYLAYSSAERLLFQFKGEAFTQRQFITYEIVKFAIGPQPAAPVSIDQNNWRQKLELFTSDMLIYIEAKNLNKFNIDRTEITQYFERYQQSSAAKNLAKEFWLTEKDLYEGIERFLRVRKFTNNKAQSFDQRVPDEFKNWVKYLEEKYQLRYLDDAMTFIVLETPYPLSTL